MAIKYNEKLYTIENLDELIAVFILSFIPIFSQFMLYSAFFEALGEIQEINKKKNRKKIELEKNRIEKRNERIFSKLFTNI